MFITRIKGQDSNGKSVEFVSSQLSQNSQGPGSTGLAVNPLYGNKGITGLPYWYTRDSNGNFVMKVGVNGFTSTVSAADINSEIQPVLTKNLSNSSESQSASIRLIIRRYEGNTLLIYFDNEKEKLTADERYGIHSYVDENNNRVFTKIKLSDIGPEFDTGYTYELASENISSESIRSDPSTLQYFAPIGIKESNGWYILRLYTQQQDSFQYTGLTFIPVTNAVNYSSSLGFIGIDQGYYYKEFDSSLEQIKSEMSGFSNKYISR